MAEARTSAGAGVSSAELSVRLSLRDDSRGGGRGELGGWACEHGAAV